MLSQGPDILLQGYDIIHPSCGIQPRMLARAPSRHMGAQIPLPLSPIPYIYTPVHPLPTRRCNGFLGGARQLLQLVDVSGDDASVEETWKSTESG